MTAAYFDGWFADIERSTERQALFSRGLEVPSEVQPSNLVPLAGLQEIAALLDVGHDGLLVDMACGRGGPGMWLARQSGCRLIGVDFSKEAVRQASARRELFDLGDRADFRVGSLASSGMDSACADALVCIDAFQFSEDCVATAREFRRLLRPGGRVVITTWESVESDDERMGPRIRSVQHEEQLRSAGFVDVVVSERPEWHASAKRFWENVVAMGPAADPALQSTYEEGVRSLPIHDRMRRVLGVGRAP